MPGAEEACGQHDKTGVCFLLPWLQDPKSRRPSPDDACPYIPYSRVVRVERQEGELFGGSFLCFFFKKKWILSPSRENLFRIYTRTYNRTSLKISEVYFWHIFSLIIMRFKNYRYMLAFRFELSFSSLTCPFCFSSHSLLFYTTSSQLALPFCLSTERAVLNSRDRRKVGQLSGSFYQGALGGLLLFCVPFFIFRCVSYIHLRDTTMPHFVVAAAGSVVDVETRSRRMRTFLYINIHIILIVAFGKMKNFKTDKSSIINNSILI